MIPLFKSNYSYGRSILRTSEILSILKSSDLESAYFVEDNLCGLPHIQSLQKDWGKQCRFGVVIKVGEEKSFHKVNVFALNKEGFLALYKIFDIQERDGAISEDDLLSLWNDALHLAIPFYDSYVYQNCFTFSDFLFTPEKFGKFTVFQQDNGLPQDMLISAALPKVISNTPPTLCKTILYESPDDYDAFVTYKLICNRSYGKPSLSKPNLEFCGSNRFSWQSFLEESK